LTKTHIFSNLKCYPLAGAVSLYAFRIVYYTGSSERKFELDRSIRRDSRLGKVSIKSMSL